MSAYKVERYNQGCKECGDGATWVIVGPDGVASATSYGDKDQADEICELQNEAYEKGLAAGK